MKITGRDACATISIDIVNAGGGLHAPYRLTHSTSPAEESARV